MNRLLQRAMVSFILFCFLGNRAVPQARMVLDGAFVNISSGASLVVENPASNAIVRNSGHIISEGENNVLQWHIGATNGTYVVPWGFGHNNYTPLSFTKDSGSGAGHFVFSTYQTGWLNSAELPATVSNLNSDGSDNSSFALDRFWQISARGYTVKPTLANLAFAYRDGEHLAEGNTITEGNLQAQRWNDNLSQWGDYAPAGVGDSATNTVAVSSVAPNDLFGWWVLVDKIQPLPVELLFFHATPHGRAVVVKWATASEQDSDFFTVERSKDGKMYGAVETVTGAGSSSVRTDYGATDNDPLEGVSYYRLRQVDQDGTVRYSEVEAVEVPFGRGGKLVIYPNPTTDKTLFVEFYLDKGEEVRVELFDVLGRKVPFKTSKGRDNLLKVTVGPSVKPGAYILQAQSGIRMGRQKVIIQ